MQPTRREWVSVVAPIVVALLLGGPGTAEAGCNVIPVALTTFRSTLGSVNRPFARPGDWLRVTLDEVCDQDAPRFLPDAADHVVTFAFTPPRGGPRTVLVRAADCRAVDLAACEAVVDGARVECQSLGPATLPSVLDVVDERTLRFRFPNTDRFLGVDGDLLTLTGPVRIGVTAVGAPLPCGLATAPCASQAGTLACKDGWRVGREQPRELAPRETRSLDDPPGSVGHCHLEDRLGESIPSRAADGAGAPPLNHQVAELQDERKDA